MRAVCRFFGIRIIIFIKNRICQNKSGFLKIISQFLQKLKVYNIIKKTSSMKKLKNLNHSVEKIKSGGQVIVIDRGSVIDSEAEAMLQALHSRSIGGLMHHMKVLEERGADNFMKNFYVGYGHKSIGDLGSTTIFVEGISMLAAKAIQD